MGIELERVKGGMNQESDFDQKRRKVTAWAWAATVAYGAVLIALACMVFFGEEGVDEFLYMTLNEVGDLLAGIAGPLAFIWLVCGYLLQGIAIRQQAEQVALGAKALSIQAAEMEQLKKRRRSEISPEFYLRCVDGNSSELGRRKIEIEIKNSGEIARNVELLFFGAAGIEDPAHIAEIGRGHCADASIKFDENFKEKVRFLIKYINRDGDADERVFEMEIQRMHGTNISGIVFNAVST